MRYKIDEALTDAYRWFADTAQRALSAGAIAACIVLGIVAGMRAAFPRNAHKSDTGIAHMESLASAKAATDEMR